MNFETDRFHNNVRVFAYGSNMSPIQMRERCPSAEFLFKGSLMDYSLVFDRWSRRWQGGVANVREDKASEVSGVIWKISSEDLRQLDRHEGFNLERSKEKNAYNRVTLKILNLRGDAIDCEVYIGVSQGVYEPNPAYMRRLEEGRRLLEIFSLGNTPHAVKK